MAGTSRWFEDSRSRAQTPGIPCSQTAESKGGLAGGNVPGIFARDERESRSIGLALGEDWLCYNQKGSSENYCVESHLRRDRQDASERESGIRAKETLIQHKACADSLF